MFIVYCNYNNNNNYYYYCAVAGTQYSVVVVVYNELSHYRLLHVRNVTVDISTRAALFDNKQFADDLQPSDLFLTGQRA